MSFKDFKKRNAKKEGSPTQATEILQNLLEKGNSPLAGDFKRYRMKLEWQQVVGATLAEKCSPIAYTNGILYLWVSSASWMSQLFYVRRELLKKINAYMGSQWARELRLTQNKQDVPKDALWTETTAKAERRG